MSAVLLIRNMIKSQQEIEKDKQIFALGNAYKDCQEELRKHPKGFCYICGKKNGITIHHLKEQTINKSGKTITRKVNGTIPICRYCHNYLEELKCDIGAYKRGIQQERSRVLEIIDKVFNKIWAKPHKYKEEWEQGHYAGWNDCIEYLDEELKQLLDKT